jgi:hypothetical protein
MSELEAVKVGTHPSTVSPNRLGYLKIYLTEIFWTVYSKTEKDIVIDENLLMFFIIRVQGFYSASDYLLSSL